MKSRLALSSALAVLVVGLSACATTTRQPRLSYSEELAQLSADCVERGGILVPTGSGTTGRPQTDYVCRISGGGTRIP